MPPVSSYVGYSIEEPWGRPRVVFGVNAEDAERLAALLQESVGYGPDGLPRAADPGYRPPVPGAFAADRPAVPDRGYPDRGYPDHLGYADRGYSRPRVRPEPARRRARADSRAGLAAGVQRQP